MKKLAFIFTIALATLFNTALRADDYPTRPITLVAVFGPGSASDTICRVIAEPLGIALKETVIVEDRPGANGALAALYVAHAAPDGHTLLMGISTLAINPSIYPSVGYDPTKDFSPIGLMARSQNVLLVHPSVSATSVGELIAAARATPGKLTFASTGGGNSVQLAAELFAAMAGVTLTQVPYKGGA